MNEPVKILSLVSYKFLPPAMGGQKGIAFFNRYLGRHVDLVCVTTSDNSGTRQEPYPIRNILSCNKLRYINVLYFFTLRRIIREEKITHLLLEHPYYGWLALLLRSICRVKLVVHSHNIESYRFKTMGKWWWGILWHYEKMTHREADHSFFIHDADREFAISYFKLDPARCSTITYGFELSQAPTAEEKRSAREIICRTHNIGSHERILLFNGTLGYKPNLDALDNILEKINPILIESGLQYRIIICGNKLPVQYQELTEYRDKHIVYAGFVDDINLYFKGSDIFINPVIEGGGIKTKVVEALGNNLTVISTQSGAVGIPPAITGQKMYIVEDNDWKKFADLIRTIDPAQAIPDVYFDHFYWGNITKKAAVIFRER